MTAATASALRWSARWRAIGWLLLFGVVLGSLLPLGKGIAILGIDKVEHFLGYALLMFWFGALHAPSRRIWFVLGFIALGALLELAQGATGWRKADLNDLVAGAFGVVVGALLAQRFGLALFQRVERALGAGTGTD